MQTMSFRHCILVHAKSLIIFWQMGHENRKYMYVSETWFISTRHLCIFSHPSLAAEGGMYSGWVLAWGITVPERVWIIIPCQPALCAELCLPRSHSIGSHHGHKKLALILCLPGRPYYLRSTLLI